MFFFPQRFAAFLAPLTSGRVTIAVSSIYTSKVLNSMVLISALDINVAFACASHFGGHEFKPKRG